MMIKLKDYQSNAVEELLAYAKKLLAKAGQGKVCVFQAPTGSGKTLMTGTFIETLTKSLPDEDFCFVWVTIGKGDLHIQSRDSLVKLFDGSPKVSLIEDEFAGSRDSISQNEVVVVNWEKLRSKDSKTGDWKNILMKDGEKTNFREVLANTRQARKVILVIDESHIGATAERTNELRKEINADLVLEMSATPKINPDPKDLARGLAGYVLVEPKDVIDEGMIKKELIINEGIELIGESESDSQEVVLESAFKKRLELKKNLETEGSKVNPLVLIQIPTADAGQDKIEAIRAFLSKKKVTERKNGKGNGRLAIWLAEQKSETLEWISEPDNDVEFLVFKQAIDTGWDCPRAHILVKFRESHSETFEIQTVGRILRMPEQRHYINEELNRGYIYTNIQSIIVKREEYNPNIIKHLKATRVANYASLKLPSFYRSRIDYGDITASFTPEFEKAACEHFGIKLDHTLFAQNVEKTEKSGVVMNVNKYQQEILADAKIDGATFDEIEGKIDGETRAKLSIAGNDLQALFEQIIRGHLGSFKNVKRSVPAVKSAIYSWFRRYLGSAEWTEEMLLIQKIILHNGNRKAFDAVLRDSIESYRIVRGKEVKKKAAESEQFYEFDIKPEAFYNQHTDELCKTKHYVYNPCYLNVDRSRPERRFEEFISTKLDKIQWWWKNGEGKQDYFGIRYEYPPGDVHTFYPDYLIQLSSGQLLILEVKDKDDRDGSTYTKAKSEALQSYLKKLNRPKVTGGIVIERPGGWFVNSKMRYSWQSTLKDDWSDWKPLEKFPVELDL